jgi:NOL1/NOP2/fmu family ribosome biogenesis protein
VLEKDALTPSEPAPLAAELTAEPGDEDWVAVVTERYGLPEAVWRDLRVQRQTRRGLHLIAADHCPPAAPSAEGSGLFFQRTNVRPSKLTTAGALLLGAQATAHRLELTAAQRDAYLARQPIRPTAAQTADLRAGQVLVTYHGFPIGLAVWHRSGSLESLFPSRWSGCAGGSAEAASP